MKKSIVTCLVVTLFCTATPAAEDLRPNVLWITSEDNGPHIGAYGDEFADTPHIDSIADAGMIYLNAWSTAPVCAPARTTIISGMYPPSTGSQHMRSMVRLPQGMKMFPQYLRAAGYYCTNNAKEDYNLDKPGKVWDVSSNKGHWRGRKPGQPFFAVFNFGESHESNIRTRPHTLVHDPAEVRVPAYHPDTPEVRLDWAQYYDKITEMDARVGRVLRQLDEDGLADETIIFYYGDHGSGMPRSKRWPYNSGLHVPMIVSIPKKFRRLATKGYATGGKSDRLVGFIDLAPTMLSLAGIKPPRHMQGHAFLGEYAAGEQPFGHGFRGRMDERFDMVRVARDKRYIYIRNYMPHKEYGQHVAYMFQTPTTQVWKSLYDQGKLKPPKTFFWEPKPAEELYDLDNDPDEVRNLVDSPEHQQILTRLRKAQQDLAHDIRDVGFLPEGEIHARSEGLTPYEMGHDATQYPMQKIMAAAELASSLKKGVADQLVELLGDDDSAVRYWAVMGLLMRGSETVDACRESLHKALNDPSPYVCVVAAEALARYGNKDDLGKALPVLLDLAPVDRNGVCVSMAALNTLDLLGEKAKSARQTIAAFPETTKNSPKRMGGYVKRLLQKILTDLPAGDWTQWGGSDGRNMVSYAKGLPDAFVPGKKRPSGEGIDPPTTENVRWTARLGLFAYGNPTVARGKVFVGTDDGLLPLIDDRLRRTRGGMVQCLNEATGKLLWKLVTPKREKLPKDAHFGHQFLGTCSSPTVDGDRVYVVTTACELVCLDVDGQADGNDGPFTEEGRYMVPPDKPPVELNATDADILWIYDMIDEAGVVPHDAASCAALVHGNVVYVGTSNGMDKPHVKMPAPQAPSLIALDKHTGRLLATDGEKIGTRMFHAQWASPSLGKVNGRTLIFFGGGDGVCYAFEALSEKPSEPIELKTVWSYDCNPPEYKLRDGKPIPYYDGDRRKRRGNNDDGLYVGPSQIIATPVFHNNRVYVPIGQDPAHGRGKGLLHCIDATGTGDVTGSAKVWSYDGLDRSLSNVTIADGLAYCPDVAGRLHCLDANSGRCYWVYETKAETWGTPLVADGKVYLGNQRDFYVFAAGRKAKLLNKIHLGSAIYSSPIVANRVLYVTSQKYLWAVAETPLAE